MASNTRRRPDTLTTVIVRNGVLADVDAVLDLWARAADPTSLPSDSAIVTQLLSRDPDGLAVAEVEGHVVGSLIAGWDGWRFHLYRLAVDPDRRREGIAGALVAYAAKRARRVGARRLDAMVEETNEAGIAFWRSAGFNPYLGDRRWSVLL